jgi:hypothetical protein
VDVSVFQDVTFAARRTTFSVIPPGPRITNERISRVGAHGRRNKDHATSVSLGSRENRALPKDPREKANALASDSTEELIDFFERIAKLMYAFVDASTPFPEIFAQPRSRQANALILAAKTQCLDQQRERGR